MDWYSSLSDQQQQIIEPSMDCDTTATDGFAKAATDGFAKAVTDGFAKAVTDGFAKAVTDSSNT